MKDTGQKPKLKLKRSECPCMSMHAFVCSHVLKNVNVIQFCDNLCEMMVDYARKCKPIVKHCVNLK